MIIEYSSDFIARNRKLVKDRQHIGPLIQSDSPDILYEVDWKYDVAGYMSAPIDFTEDGTLIIASNHILRQRIKPNDDINDVIHIMLSLVLTKHSYVCSVYAERKCVIIPHDPINPVGIILLVLMAKL